MSDHDSHGAHGHEDDGHGGHGHHLIPYHIYYKVFGGLIFLTILTVVTAKYVDLGILNLPLALLIASTKAGLVVAFFMALKYDNKVNVMILGLGCVFVVIFLSITLLDTNFRSEFEPLKDTLVNEEETRLNELAREDSLIKPLFEQQPVINQVDSTLFRP